MLEQHAHCACIKITGLHDNLKKKKTCLNAKYARSKVQEVTGVHFRMTCLPTQLQITDKEVLATCCS